MQRGWNSPGREPHHVCSLGLCQGLGEGEEVEAGELGRALGLPGDRPEAVALPVGGCSATTLRAQAQNRRDVVGAGGRPGM